VFDHAALVWSAHPKRAAAVALVTTLALAAACWVLALHQMRGMDMGVATDLGAFPAFIAAWVPMMAAMMLPGAAPPVMKCAGSVGGTRRAAMFVVAYVAVWAVLGVAVYALYRPHSTAAASALVIAAGIYELTPLKARCRRRCRTAISTGTFSCACIGSSIGLMAAFIALGVMSVMWMGIAALLLIFQKVFPPHRGVDIGVALAIVALGVLLSK
jgi:predicted metal-binding membrane protein